MVVTWLMPHEIAAISAHSVYTIQLCTMSCHFMLLHIDVIYLPRSLSSPMLDILIIVLNCIEGTSILKYKYRVLADFFVVTKEVKFIFLLSIYKVFCDLIFCVVVFFIFLFLLTCFLCILQ